MLRPLEDRVIVKAVEAEEVTKAGIVLPNSAKEKSEIAEVVAVGPGSIADGKQVAMNVKVGDRVVCAKYSGTEIKYGDVEYTIYKQSDILAVEE